MSAPLEISALIERFALNQQDYTSGQYNETQLRREFLDPFFESLGWDVNNRQGSAESYKDVIHEDSIKIGGMTKAPDYCFRIGGTRKFFVEAKKLSVNLKDDISPAFQLRRYAWSAKLPLSILSDFEEFSVYDCRVKPDKSDKPSTARTIYITYKEYEKRWDEIASIFSLEAIRKGSFDRYADSEKKKKGTAEVDAAFLKEIETWRELLARNIALRNPALSQRELNFAVQQTIDRIIFLRICEDRGIEQYGRLQAAANGANVYQRLCELFRQADDRYNSGLFHFTREKDREHPDELTLNLSIDDKSLKDSINGLYYPDCPYEFSVLSADILGQVYEQFLGKVIRLTEVHRAVIEDKPEVKKAGGVYYTPTYIVDYIVKNTVGPLVGADQRVCPENPEGRTHGFAPTKTSVTPKEVSNLRILDPACGSGSFLIGAYQYLLDWHLQWYTDHDPESWAKKRNPPIFDCGIRNAEFGLGKNYRLTTSERKRILLNNIYGVDIDPQAVEVTKLSLLLKVLEGESEQTISSQLKMFQERALPDLDHNIKCGNSLIGPDFYTPLSSSLALGTIPSLSPRGKGGQRGVQQQLFSFDDDERLRINVFDWKAEFPHIFPSPSKGEGRGEGAGGFDAVIGNPPYIRIQALKEWAPVEVEFYKQRYDSAKKGNYDIYVVFVEKGLNLLNSKGVLGFILPHKFFNAQYGEPLRYKVSKGKYLAQIVHFGAQQVFEGATTYTCLMFLEKAGKDTFEFIKVDDLVSWRESQSATKGKISAASASLSEWNFTVGKGASLFKKLSQMQLKLGDVAEIYVGLQTSADDVYIMSLTKETSQRLILKSKALDKEWQFEKDLLFPLISGTDVNRYALLPERQYILFPYKINGFSVQLIDIDVIKNLYPQTAEYLIANKKRLEDREKGEMKSERWHGYIYLKNMGKQNIKKICVPRLVERLYASYDIEGIHFLDNVDVCGITLIHEYQQQTLIYLLGLINSKLLQWYFPFVSAPFRGGWLSANRQFLSQVPIRTIDFSNPTDKVRHDKMVSLVEQMLELNRKLAATKLAHEKTALERQITATDRQIDVLVYELYGLTEEEIQIVEKG